MVDRPNNELKGYLSKVPIVIAGTLLMILIVECNVNIIGRYLRIPIEASYDFLSLVGVLMIAFSIISTELNRGHVVVSIFVISLSRRKNIRAVFDIIVHLISIGSILWLVWAIFYHVVKVSIPNNELAMTMQISCAPFRIGWALGWIILCIFIIKNLSTTLIKDFKKKGLEI